MTIFDDLDPDWAWEPWEATAEDPWDAAKGAHLARRAGFGPTRSWLAKSTARGLEKTLDELFSDRSAFDARVYQESDQLVGAILGGQDPRQLASWWLRWMSMTPQPLVEKMTLFWHGHFATSAEKVVDVECMYRQNQLLRDGALGSFPYLVQGIAKDPAMLIYLDSAFNRKGRPNENFARELVELFCLGEGHYNEQDVQQLARCFTGWEVRRNRFRFNPYQHDDGEKTIFGKGGIRSGEEAVDEVLRQSTAAQFIVGKLFRSFFADEPAPPPHLLAPLALRFRETGLEIGPLVRRMLSSRLFFSSRVVARKIRSPVELVLGILRALDATVNYRLLADGLERLGQGLFYPPSVKGWEGGRVWINSSTLVGRANLIHALVNEPTTRFGGGGLSSWAGRAGAGELADFLREFVDICFAVSPGAQRIERLLEDAQDSSSGEARYRRLVGMLAALPEIHLC